MATSVARLTSCTFSLADVEAGLPLSALQKFLQFSGLATKDLYSVVIPARTLKHRSARKESLTLDESDKLARMARVHDHAVKVFGDKDKALRWLSRPKRRFDDRTPIEMLRTEYGSRLVDEMLGQIDHGMFA